MAVSYKDIIITPNRGSSTSDPQIAFQGGNTSVNTTITLRVYPEANGTLSFEGSAGQLFSITNDLTGSIYSVNDVSGIPSIDVNADGTVSLAPYSGNVAIGRSSAGYKLDVFGSVNASALLVNGTALGGFSSADDTSTNATYYPVVATTAGGSTARTSSTKLTFNPSTGTLSSTVFNSLSDINYKKNINTLDHALYKVDLMRGVSFHWKDTDNKSSGVIAQEIEKVAPELVTETNGIKNVNYDGLIGYLIESIKELKARIEKLEKNG